MSRRNQPPAPIRVNGESERSRRYRAGKAVRYSGRIHGPTFPVTSYSVEDLPDDSALRADATMGAWFANRALRDSDIDLGLKVGHGKAYE